MNRVMLPNGRSVARFSPLSRVFDELFNDSYFTVAPQRSHAGLAVDVSETDGDLIARASLPGFTEQEIDAEINDGVLTIRAAKAEEKDETGERWHTRERRTASLERQIALPAPIREADVTAELVNGVLTLKMPKVQKALPRKISITPGTTTDAHPSSGGGACGCH